MTQKTRDTIGTIANIILETFAIRTPITDIDAIVVTMGGEIEEIDGQCLEEHIQRSPKGMGFLMKLTRGQDTPRRNFAIAQELGHAVLHLGYLNDWETWDAMMTERTRIGLTHQEFEAHEFAAAFLMPKEAYLDYVYHHSQDGQVEIGPMAAYFGVPEAKAINRGKWLGVLQWR